MFNHVVDWLLTHLLPGFKVVQVIRSCWVSGLATASVISIRKKCGVYQTVVRQSFNWADEMWLQVSVASCAIVGQAVLVAQRLIPTGGATLDSVAMST